MREEIRVKGSRIVVGEGVAAELGAMLPEGVRAIVLTDENCAAAMGAEMGGRERIVIAGGEENKTLATVEKIYRGLIELGADRGTWLVGWGGGIVTDVAGFVAATYMRGMAGCGYVASSLLAQVDASVGGKCGANVEGYKNMAGVFSQPDFVLCDTALLATLPEREFRAGVAEMIKAGVIGDVELFEMLEAHGEEELRAEGELLVQAVVAAVRLKARIVEADEREAGERRKLNLGHTVGHAVEKLSRRWNHGEAVAIGMAEVCRESARRGMLEVGARDRIIGALERYGLPTEHDLTPEAITEAVRRDKKAESGCLRWVVPVAVGEVIVTSWD